MTKTPICLVFFYMINCPRKEDIYVKSGGFGWEVS